MLKQAAEQEESTPIGAPPTAAEGVEMVQENAVTPANQEEPATPEEQAEYERAVGALGKVMYEDDNTAGAVVDQLREEDPVGSMVKAAILLVRQIDDRLDLDENVIAQFTMEVADRVIDLYENKFGTELEEADVEKVAAATWEGVLQVYDIDEEDYRQFTQGMPPDEVKAMEQQYQEKLGGGV